MLPHFSSGYLPRVLCSSRAQQWSHDGITAKEEKGKFLKLDTGCKSSRVGVHRCCEKNILFKMHQNSLGKSSSRQERKC